MKNHVDGIKVLGKITKFLSFLMFIKPWFFVSKKPDHQRKNSKLLISDSKIVKMKISTRVSMAKSPTIKKDPGFSQQIMLGLFGRCPINSTKAPSKKVDFS